MSLTHSICMHPDCGQQVTYHTGGGRGLWYHDNGDTSHDANTYVDMDAKWRD